MARARSAINADAVRVKLKTTSSSTCSRKREGIGLRRRKPRARAVRRERRGGRRAAAPDRADSRPRPRPTRRRSSPARSPRHRRGSRSGTRSSSASPGPRARRTRGPGWDRRPDPRASATDAGCRGRTRRALPGRACAARRRPACRRRPRRRRGSCRALRRRARRRARARRSSIACDQNSSDVMSMATSPSSAISRWSHRSSCLRARSTSRSGVVTNTTSGISARPTSSRSAAVRLCVPQRITSSARDSQLLRRHDHRLAPSRVGQADGPVVPARRADRRPRR